MDVQHFLRIEDLRAVLHLYKVDLVVRFWRLRRVILVIRVLLADRLRVHHHGHVDEDDLLVGCETFTLEYYFLHVGHGHWLLLNFLEKGGVQYNLPHVEYLVTVSVVRRSLQLFLF